MHDHRGLSQDMMSVEGCSHPASAGIARDTVNKPTPCHENMFIDDPDVRIAAEALEELGAGKSTGNRRESVFLDRVASYHPIISSAVNAYEASKSKVPGLRFSTEVMESVARPVTSRFDMDAFACRQLDRIESNFNGSSIAIVPTSPSSKWHGVIVSAGSIGAAFSEESIRGLRYCIQWLRFTNNNVECMIEQMLDLLSLKPEDAVVPQSEISHRLAVFKANIVETIKRTVDMVGRYAGSALPGPARVRVREYILGIPGRWERKSDGSQTEETKVMCLARECLEVLAGVCSVLEDTLSGAEDWCERLGKRSVDQDPRKRE